MKDLSRGIGLAFVAVVLLAMSVVAIATLLLAQRRVLGVGAKA